MTLFVLLYMGAATAATFRAGTHFIVKLLAAQYLLLLPTIVLYLRSRSGSFAAGQDRHVMQDERLARREFRFHHHVIYRGKWFSKYFMRSGGGFVAQDMNGNEVDWKRAPAFYMADPGPERRIALACALNRPRWILVGYEAASGSAQAVEGGTGGACTQR